MRRLALAALAAFVLSPTPVSPQVRRPLAYDDYYRIETPGQVALSPDGRHVAFVRSRVLEEQNRSHGELWLVDADGRSAPVGLTGADLEASGPRWTPDGTLLAFSARGNGAEDGRGSTIRFMRTDAPGETFEVPGVQRPAALRSDEPLDRLHARGASRRSPPDARPAGHRGRAEDRRPVRRPQLRLDGLPLRPPRLPPRPA